MTISKEIKDRRKMAGLSQSGLARLAGVSRGTIVRAEVGEDLGEASLRLIASALKLPPNYFLGDPKPEPANSRFHLEIDLPDGFNLSPDESRLIRQRMIEFFHSTVKFIVELRAKDVSKK